MSAMDVREEDLEPIEILLDPSLEPISIMQQPITAEEGDILGNQEASKDETGLVVWSAGSFSPSSSLFLHLFPFLLFQPSC